MALFRYWALDEKGKKKEATIDADSFQDARAKLFQRHIAAIRLVPLAGHQAQPHLNRVDVVRLTSELARLLRVGLPLLEALTALEEKYRNQKPHALLLDLSDRVRSGESFSLALGHHDKNFDILYVAMVANAEKTGRLSEALQELSQLLSRSLALRKQIISTLLYPALLGSFCFLVLSMLLFFVIPSLRELFEGRELHPFTQIVFAVSDFACRSQGLLALAFLTITSCVTACFFLASWKKKIFSLLQRLPFLSPLFAKIAFIRFCRASATLLEGGVSVVTTLAQARGVMQHHALEAVVALAEQKIQQGEPLHASFQNQPLIPLLVPRMIAIAEQGGQLPFMMTQIAQIYEDELDTTLARFTALAQPVLLLVLGAIVGFVLLSVLLPLTDISGFVEN